MSILDTAAVAAARAALRDAGATLVKTGGDPERVYALAGELYLSKSGWVLLSVPNALVRGAFDALEEVGVELPFQSGGNLNAHITVIRPEELEQLGGADRLTERGHKFRYTLGPVKCVEPSGWKGVSKVWYVEVKSPELEKLRKSYGLSPTPNGGDHEFHITVARRLRRVTQPGDAVVKASAAEEPDPEIEAEIEAFKKEKRYLGRYKCPHCGGTNLFNGIPGTGTTFRGSGHCQDCDKGCSIVGLKLKRIGDGPELVSTDEQLESYRKRRRWEKEQAREREAEKSSAHVPEGGTVSYDYHCTPCDHSFDGNAGKCPLCAEDRSATTTNPRLLEKPAAGVDDLKEVKRRSDVKDYKGKTVLLRRLMKSDPAAWAVDSEAGHLVGVTHLPTRFRYHVPGRDVHDLRAGFAKLAGWGGDAPSVVKLPLRGGDQSVCPRCGRAITHDLYTDKKGWKFHRSCFGKGKGPVKEAGLLEKLSVSAALVERARAAAAARGGTRAAKFEQTRDRWLTGRGQAADGLPGGHLGRVLRDLKAGKRQGFSEMVKTLGTTAGTDHKRLAISEKLLGERGLKGLGFERVLVAIPETGQTRFSSLRHVGNEFHWHPHKGYWTVHEDRHPSIPMAVRRATSAGDKARAYMTGMKHVLGEGFPGFQVWAGNALTGGRPILHAMQAERPGAFIRSRGESATLPAWNPSFLRREVVPATATAGALGGLGYLGYRAGGGNSV